MNKKVLILSSSPRKGGNSGYLSIEHVTQLAIHSKCGFCKGCFACLKLGHCVIKDDAVEIV